MSDLKNNFDEDISAAIELNYRRYLIKVLMVVALPTLIAFSIRVFLLEKYFVGLILSSMVVILVGLFFYVRKPRIESRENLIYESFLTVLFILYGLFLVYRIGYDGDLSRIPWAYVFPVIVFFALGTLRAFLWVIILLLALLSMDFLFAANKHVVLDELNFRFYMSFLLVILASFFFERIKRKYQKDLIENQQTLVESEKRSREALDRLKEEVKERQNAEKASRASETRFREMADNISEVFWLFDWIEQKVIYVSSAYEKIWGRSLQDLYNRYDEWADSIYPEDSQYAEESFVKIGETGGGEEREYRIIRPDGSIRWISDRGFAIKDENGQVIRVAGIAKDATQSKEAEKALRESEERFREMAELMPQTVFETDISGKLTFVNKNAFENFGYSQADFDSGVNSLEMLVVEDRERAAENIAKIIEGENIGLNEYTALRKDGSTFPILVHSATIVRDEHTTGIRGFIIDMTDRQKAEEERRRLETQFHQAQKLETIGTLAGGIAHDFNNLMTTILGNTSLILYDIDEDSPHYEPLKNIERQIKRGAELTTQLLGYARKGKYQVKPVNLNQIVEESATAFGRTRKEITIGWLLADDLMAVEADKGQIQQVLLNLFVNAADAMPTGGSLELSTSNVTHHEIESKDYHPAPGNYLRLTVSDTGIGMDENVRQRIFDPFFSTKETGKGTGLGLASVYGIIKNHGGYIEVTSQKGQGSQFSIYLPASAGQIVHTAEPVSEIMKGSGTILIVDDEEMVLNVGARILQKLGYTVLESTNGANALELYKKLQDQIKLVVLDIVMPNMGGGEVYDRLQEINPEIKVLLASGYSIDDQAREIMERGCDGFIQKPFSVKTLSDKINEVLAKKGRD